MKRSVTSSISSLMFIDGTAGTAWPMMLVFLMLIVSPNSLQMGELADQLLEVVLSV